MSIPEQLQSLFSQARLVDLSYPIEEGMPCTADHPYYYHNLWNSQQYGVASNSYLMLLHEHTGTHVDAPGHFYRDGATIETLPLERFFLPCLTIGIDLAEGEREIDRERLTAWEAQHQPIRPGEAVLLRTGWSRYWQPRQAGQIFCRDWPGLSADGAAYLLEKQVKLVGTEAFSIDPSASQSLPAHKLLLGQDVLVAECLNRLAELPERSFLMMLPLPIRQGSASPVRIVAVCEAAD